MRLLVGRSNLAVRVVLGIGLFIALAIEPAGAEEAAESRLAAAFQLPQVPGLSGPSADWRQWDSFFTFVVKRVGENMPADLKDSLADAFLDSRYELTNAIAPGKGGDPVPQLFVNGWNRLSPVLNKALPGLPQQTASQYKNFISAADKLAAVAGQQGLQQLGLLKLSPDVLSGMARMVDPGGTVDALAYNVNVDSALRNLLGFGAPLAAPQPPAPVRKSRSYRFLPEVKEASILPSWFVGTAVAAEPDISKLNKWVPDQKELRSYLAEVRSLLTTLSDKVAVKSKLVDAHRSLYRQIVFAAGWQESCWRQFIMKGKDLTPLASATGDVGLMQVNRNTWRGVYDLNGLGGDIEYNGNAGGEILLQYLTRYAIRKNEDKQQGGNLARATYAAYNGGPGHLTRYRAAKQNPVLKKVDEAFWEKFQAVSSGREMDVENCYRK